MRIIAGESRGIKLKTLQGSDIVRPTIERVKEGIFSSIHFFVEGAYVLDLFAGSGQMGIEALSRGAAHCVFIDEDKNAIEIIKSNLKAANLLKNATVIHTDASNYLLSSQEKFNLIFLDPPYKNNIVEEILPNLQNVLNDDAIIIAETEIDAKIPDRLGSITLKKQYKYSSVRVTKYIVE